MRAQVIREPNRASTFDSKWEKEFWTRMELLRRSGNLVACWHKGYRFRIGTGSDRKGSQASWYTPDVSTLNNEGELIHYDVKGFHREAAKVRIRAAAMLYPFQFIVATKGTDGNWEYEVYE